MEAGDSEERWELELGLGSEEAQDKRVGEAEDGGVEPE